MLGILKKKQQKVLIQDLEPTSYPEVTNAPIPKKPAMGSYRVVPTFTVNQETHEKELFYQVLVWSIDYQRAYHNYDPQWHPWPTPGGWPRMFKTVEEAIDAYKSHGRTEHKVKMHMYQPGTEVYHPFHYIQDELNKLSVAGKLEHDETTNISTLVFDTEEDMNFYKLSSEFQEVADLKFKVKE